MYHHFNLDNLYSSVMLALCLFANFILPLFIFIPFYDNYLFNF